MTTLPTVKGVRDFYPEDLRIRSWLFETWRQVARSFGYEEYDACILESEELYLRKAGDEISSQLYNFTDKGERRVALRPEMTPSLARMIIARSGSLPSSLRWFSIPQCFRYERAQKGRKREHFQWNMDIVGVTSIAAELELMSAQVAFLRKVGLRIDDEHSDVAIRISDRRVLEHYLAEQGITGDDFVTACVVIDKHDKIGRDATIEMLAEKGFAAPTAQKVVGLLDVRGIDQLRAAVGEQNPGYRSLAELMTLAEGCGFRAAMQVDLSVVRGLSYYTGTVWELFDSFGAVPRAIAGGGRYDRLMETLGGKPTPMAGFGFGDIVIALVLEERGLLPKLRQQVDDLVFPLTAGQFVAANRVAGALRGQGRTVLVDYSERRFRHILKQAEDVGATRLWILGEDELAKGAAKVLELSGERQERTVALSELASTGGNPEDTK